MEYDYSSELITSSMDTTSLNNILSLVGAYSTILLIISILTIVELWLIFKKCGKKGYEAIIPIYNMWTFLSIADLPGWLCLIPVANIIGMLVAYFKIPKKFGKSSAFGIGMLFLPIIFMGILAFSKTKEESANNNEPNNNVEPNNVAESITVTNEPSINDSQVNNIQENISINNEVPQIDNTLESNNTINTPDLMAEPNTINNNVVNEIIPDKEFIKEEPALNMEEIEMPRMANTVVPEINNDIPVNNNIIDAFDLPPVSNSEQVIDNNIDTLDNIDEIPQGINEAINSDITITKKCPNCSTENPYVNKVCQNCGNILE